MEEQKDAIIMETQTTTIIESGGEMQDGLTLD